MTTISLELNRIDQCLNWNVPGDAADEGSERRRQI
jgi:hypothetical protein